MPNNTDKSIEQWLWDAACSIRGAKDAPKYKDYILPLVFAKRLCDVFDDEINRIAQGVGAGLAPAQARAKAFKLVARDKKLVRFYIPLQPANPDEPVWSIICKLADKIGEQLTTHLRAIADESPPLKGIIDRVDFNATTHGQRDISDDRLSALIEQISLKRLGLNDVEADIIGKSYQYLIRKFAEGSGQSAGEFYTPDAESLPTVHVMCHISMAVLFRSCKLEMYAIATAEKNINIQFLKPWLVPVPPREKQNEIVHSRDAIDKKKRLAMGKKALLEELFRTLLHQLMTGKVRIAD